MLVYLMKVVFGEENCDYVTPIARISREQKRYLKSIIRICNYKYLLV
jgi:hypothetical protein